MTRIDLELWIDAPPERVFDLSRSIDVHSASMARSRERAVAGVTEGMIHEGEQVTWRARHFGVVFRMTSHIPEMDCPHRFVDEQLEGPFASWHHTHVFTPRAGGTDMADHVTYEPPFGALGRFADLLLLRRYMTKLLVERNDFIKSVAEADPA